MAGIRLPFVLAFMLLISGLASANVNGSNGIVRIDIDSAWGGLGPAQETKVAILRTPDGYRRDGAIFPDKAVNDLIAAIYEPAFDKPDLANLGIDQAWLQAHIVMPYTGNYTGLTGNSPEQRALYSKRFTDLKNISIAIGKIYSPKYRWTDDYPSLTLTITFENGSTDKLESLSQNSFMLPWSIAMNGSETFTYNADISRAIAALLPSDATNAVRVSGTGLGHELSEYMDRAIADDWNLLDAQSRASASFVLLKSTYHVQTAEIGDRSRVGYYTAGETGRADTFDATLARQGFPENLHVALELPFDKDHAKGVDRFLKTNGSRENLVLSVPWLMQALNRFTNIPAQIVYIHDASLSENALAAFSTDMHALGKDKLTSEVAAVRERAALLITDVFHQTAWIVLPDRRVVLWHYNGAESLMDRNPADFPAHSCKTNDAYLAGGCVGVVISPTGAVEK